jgi:hypothetical protein
LETCQLLTYLDQLHRKVGAFGLDPFAFGFDVDDLGLEPAEAAVFPVKFSSYLIGFPTEFADRRIGLIESLTEPVDDCPDSNAQRGTRRQPAIRVHGRPDVPPDFRYWLASS